MVKTGVGDNRYQVVATAPLSARPCQGKRLAPCLGTSLS
jgi:hypothetical protein